MPSVLRLEAAALAENGGPPRPLGKAEPLASLYSSSSGCAKRSTLVAPSPQLLAMSSVPAWSSRQSCLSSDVVLRLSAKETSAPAMVPPSLRNALISAASKGSRSASSCSAGGPHSSDYRSRLSSLQGGATAADDTSPIPRPKMPDEAPVGGGGDEEFSGRGVSERQSRTAGPSVLHVHYHLTAEDSTASMHTAVLRKPEPRVFDPPPAAPPRSSWRECARLEYWKQVVCCSGTRPRFSSDD